MDLKLPEIKLSKQQQKNLAIGVAGGIALLFCYWQFFLKPVRGRIVESRQKIEELDVKINSAKSRAGQLDLLRVKLDNMRVEIAQAEKRLPKQKAVADLLDILTQTSRRFRVNVLTFQPMPVGSREYYLEIPFNLSLETSYHTLGLFLASLVQGDRILTVRGLNLTPKTATKDRPDLSVSATFTLIAYQYKG